MLDKDEVDRIFVDLLKAEPCIEGFLLSCDQNGKEGIERREWDYCFPKTAGNTRTTGFDSERFEHTKNLSIAVRFTEYYSNEICALS